MEKSNKIALVTGGSRGLGRNTALKLAQDGHNVVLTYHTRKEEAEQVVAEIEALGVGAVTLQFDAGNSKTFDGFKAELVEKIKAKFGVEHINFLINNAGIESYAMFPDATEEAFDSLMNVHFKGVYFLTQKLLPVLADGGRIVNFSTGLARFVTPGYSAYSSMKAAIDNFTRYLAKELGGRGITANTVAPGPIETDFTKKTFDRPGTKDYLQSQTSLGRIGQPDDIGSVVAFLCSDGAGWVTAQRIEASGGLFI
ncbi:SDR family oxidoreductase [Mucilaginibacter sp. UR6-1]|uniref:SDR family NAD(P)-dependent oxidoreductase n=1 Tax=Mucilaginibacter sp. UR6-1 TaxID=1435643 RepID=UPI001E286A9D|nr:SDR family oxidoreductase [Mucilaginibacter sp. UR6-1]MCC8410522.1 SDR family oxidoreductase [Mucilaginibacter sp. UR6-1]